MSYPCNLIQDLLPLYMDGVCSEESRQIVEQHLTDCSGCKEYYMAMREAEEVVIVPNNADRECQKAASFQSVKKKLLQKQILFVAAFIVGITIITLLVTTIMKNSVSIVEYEDNISVSMVDGSLTGRLQGSQYTHMKMKQVSVTVNGQEEIYLFFYVSDSKWDAFTTSEKVFSEYVICPADKGAEQIDHVYYYTGDYTDIESMNHVELQNVIEEAVLLWSK